MAPATAKAIRAGTIGKGDVLGVARLAGIQAAKRASDSIPLCHPLRLTGVDVELARRRRRRSRSRRPCARSIAPASRWRRWPRSRAAALTVYDMCKAIDRGMVISEVRLDEKRGGKSGTWTSSATSAQFRGAQPAKRR